MRLTLRWKILILAVAAPAALGLGALGLVKHGASSHVRATVNGSLESSSRVCESFLASRARMLAASAGVIARDPRFFAALSLPGSPRSAAVRRTVDEVARDFTSIAEADLFEVLDARGRVLASTGRRRLSAEAREPLARGSVGRGAGARIAADGERLYQVVVQPVRAGSRRVGTLLIGLAVDDELASELRRLTRSEVSFLTSGGVVSSTLESPGERRALFGATSTAARTSTPEHEYRVVEMAGGGGTMLTMVRPLPGTAPEAPAHYAVQRSLNAATAFLDEIEVQLGRFGLFILTAAILLGLLVSRRITRPVLELVRGASEMERGNYEHPLRTWTNDELGYLTERFREMRDREKAYVKSLQDVARMKSEFIDVASHELRTPASVIRGYVEILASGKMGRLAGPQKDALQAIEESLNGIERIAENAEWMAQVESDRPSIAVEEQEIRPLLERAAAEAIAEAKNRRVELRVEAEGAGAATVDASRLTQALSNLVRNAIRFTPDGGHVTVRAECDGETLEIAVADDGIGIPEEKLGRLLDRSVFLQQASHHHSSSTLAFGSAGIGLGLPIAQAIVEAHGGTLSVASREGEGSTFTMRLPLAVDRNLDRAA